MTTYRTENTLADFYRHDAEQEKWLEKRPVCSECGEHIQEDTAIFIKGEWICEQCIKEAREEIEDEL